jgi:hypothetical protein
VSTRESIFDEGQLVLALLGGCSTQCALLHLPAALASCSDVLRPSFAFACEGGVAILVLGRVARCVRARRDRLARISRHSSAPRLALVVEQCDRTAHHRRDDDTDAEDSNRENSTHERSEDAEDVRTRRRACEERAPLNSSHLCVVDRCLVLSVGWYEHRVASLHSYISVNLPWLDV